MMEARTEMPGALGKRRGFRALAWIGVGLVALVLLAAALSGPLASRWIVREARARGVELEMESVSLGWTEVRLRGVRFRLAGVGMLRGTADAMTIEHALAAPHALRGERVGLFVEGTSVRELGAWIGAYPDALSVPIDLELARVEWRRSPAGDPDVVLEGGALSARGPAGALRRANAKLGSASITVDASWTLTKEQLVLDVASSGVSAPAIRVRLVHLADSDSVVVSFARKGLDHVAAPLGAFGIAFPPGVDVEGTVDLTLGRLSDSPLRVGVDLILHGFVPPHPRELDGIVFGDRTAVRAKVVAPGTRLPLPIAEATELSVRAGALSLTGSGTLDASPSGPVVRAQLSGVVACAELGVSVLAAHLPKIAIPLGSSVMRSAVAGTAFVTVGIEAEADRLQAARITPSARLSCKLRLP